MHPIEKQIYTWMNGPDGLLSCQGTTIVVGCSTGPDSMALLHILHAITGKLALTLIPVYVDHGLRPGEVEQEKALFAKVSNTLGLLCEIVEIDVRGSARERKISIEHAARDLRYQALRAVKQQYKAHYIAVGHHADDQAEEVLIRLLRGSSRKAIAGMQRVSNDLVRPLLQLSKQQIYSYLREKSIAFCQDSSNQDTTYLRNRIRGELLPYLEQEYDPGIRKALLKTASNLQQDEALLSQLVEEVEENVVLKTEKTTATQHDQCIVDRQSLKSYHPALQRRFLEKLLWKIGAPSRYEHIIALLNAVHAKKSGHELHLPRGLRVIFSREKVAFSYPRGRGPWRGTL